MKATAIAKHVDGYEQLFGKLDGSGMDVEMTGLVGNTDLVIEQILHGDGLLLLAEVDRMSVAERNAMAAALQLRPRRKVLLISGDYSAEFLLWAMHSGVAEVVPAPAEPDELQDAVRRQLPRSEPLAARANIDKRAEVVVFLAAKGGSGATFLATNAAAALAARGKRVAVIDLNLNLGDAALFLSDAVPVRSIADLCQSIDRIDGEALEASMMQPVDNLWVLAAAESPEAGTEIAPEAITQVLELARERFDHVIVDAGRVLDARILRGLDVADSIYMVMQLALPYVHAARRLQTMFAGLGYADNKLRVIVNRFERGPDSGLRDVEEALQTQVALTVPNDFKTVTYAINHALAVFEHRKCCAVSASVYALAELIAPTKTPAAGLRKVFGFRTPFAMAPSRG